MKKRHNTPVLKCVHLLRGTCCLASIICFSKTFLTWNFVVNTVTGPRVLQLRE